MSGDVRSTLRSISLMVAYTLLYSLSLSYYRCRCVSSENALDTELVSVDVVRFIVLTAFKVVRCRSAQSGCLPCAPRGWNEQHWNEQHWNEQQWNEQQWNEQHWNEQQWNEHWSIR